MGESTWIVEEKITFNPKKKPDYRETYIRLLEQVIEALKEELQYKVPLDGDRDDPSYHKKYALPTIIWARAEPVETEIALTMQLICYADREEYMRHYEMLEGERCGEL